MIIRKEILMGIFEVERIRRGKNPSFVYGGEKLTRVQRKMKIGSAFGIKTSKTVGLEMNKVNLLSMYIWCRCMEGTTMANV